MNNLNDCLITIFSFCEIKDKLSFLATTKNIRNELHARIPNIQDILREEKVCFEKQKMEQKMEQFVDHIVIDKNDVYKIIDRVHFLPNYCSVGDAIYIATQYIENFREDFDSLLETYLSTFYPNLSEKEKKSLYDKLFAQYFHAYKSSTVETFVDIIYEYVYGNKIDFTP
jgi:hypothetical protein